MTPERQKQILAVLLIVLAAVVTIRTLPKLSSGGSSGQRSGAFATPMRRGPAVGGASEGDTFVALRLEDLERRPGEFELGRDPFRFKPKPRPAPAKAKAPPRPRPQPVRKAPPKRAAQPAGPRPPEPTFKFLGSFGSEERRVAVFSDSAEIYNVVEGGVFKEAFVVRKIGFESADIGWVNFPEEPARRLAAGG